MGNMYQWGNNYWFPSTGTISNTSSTQVDASTYWPWNYYSSSTFIYGSFNWSSAQNDDLWWDTSNSTHQECTRVTSTLTINADTTVVALKSDLANYYTKTETYTKTEVDNLIASVWSFEVVATLPSVSTADTTKIYLLGPIWTGADKYEEWIVTEDSQQQKQWTKIWETSVDLSDLNTKTFYLSSTSDLTTAQAAYDWYLEGKTPIIRYYNQYYYLRNIYSSNIRFYRIWEGIFNVNATSWFQDNGAIVFNISNNNVTSISSTSTGTSFTIVDGKEIADNWYLRVDYNYSNPYIPRYDWSPATKKYVDDNKGKNDIIESSTAPSDVNVIWEYDPGSSYANEYRYYDGYQWLDIEGIKYGSTAPTLKDNNFWILWYDTTNDVLKYYDNNGSSWVPVWWVKYVNWFGIDFSSPYWDEVEIAVDPDDLAWNWLSVNNVNWQLQVDTTVVATQTDLSWKQDKATSGSTAPSTTPTYVWQQYIDTTANKMYVATGTSSSSDWTEVGAWSGDMLYADFNWTAKTWASITLDLNSIITPSANFTVNAPATIKDWQIYVLRVITWATAYTMTLGTDITNPYSEDLTLTANTIAQFSFIWIDDKLELQPSIDVSTKWFAVVSTLPAIGTADDNLEYFVWPTWTWADKYEEYVVTYPTIEDKVTISSSSTSATISDEVTITASDISITRASWLIIAYRINVYQNWSVLFWYSDGWVPSWLLDANWDPVNSITIPAWTISASDFSTITSISIKVGEHTEKTWTKVWETTPDLSAYALNSDVNVKVFKYTGSSLDPIRAAAAWINAWKTPIIEYNWHYYTTSSYTSWWHWYLYATNIDIASGSSTQNKMSISYDMWSITGVSVTQESVGWWGNVIAMTQQEYNALPTAEKNDGKLRIITDAPTESITVDWDNVANKPWMLTMASWSPISSVQIWVWTQAQYDALTTKDPSVLYFTTQVVS